MSPIVAGVHVMVITMSPIVAGVHVMVTTMSPIVAGFHVMVIIAKCKSESSAMNCTVLTKACLYVT